MSGRERLGAAEAILNRFETYRRALQVSVLVNLALAVVALVAVAMAWAAVASKPEPRYFATREDGGIIPLVAISQPFLTDGQVTNFAVEGITRAMTMDFANWRSDLLDASRYFQRPQGWEDYLAALRASGVLDLIEQRRMVSTAVANGAVIVASGLDPQGRYTWTVQVPLSVTYESAQQRTVENQLAEITVTRVPTWESSDAVGISRVVMRSSR